jgi:rhomboid family GlyGly-CTERM serine protease
MIIQPAGPRAFPLLRTIGDKWLLCLVVSILACMATVWPGGLEHLRYDRIGLAHGEVWRIFSAHFVHLNLFHLFLNLCGLVLICELQWGTMPLRHGFGLMVTSAAAIGMALWWLQPELEWYAGLSGVLHGLWAGCACYGLRSAPDALSQPLANWRRMLMSRPLHLAGLILIALKLGLESLYGPSGNTEQIIGGSVVTSAHLYGAVAGFVYVLFLRPKI